MFGNLSRLSQSNIKCFPFLVVWKEAPNASVILLIYFDGIAVTLMRETGVFVHYKIKNIELHVIVHYQDYCQRLCPTQFHDMVPNSALPIGHRANVIQLLSC